MKAKKVEVKKAEQTRSVRDALQAEGNSSHRCGFKSRQKLSEQNELRNKIVWLGITFVGFLT